MKDVDDYLKVRHAVRIEGKRRNGYSPNSEHYAGVFAGPKMVLRLGTSR